MDLTELMERLSRCRSLDDVALREKQMTCTHVELTCWLRGDGYEARLCKDCMKEVETRPIPDGRVSTP